MNHSDSTNFLVPQCTCSARCDAWSDHQFPAEVQMLLVEGATDSSWHNNASPSVSQYYWDTVTGELLAEVVLWCDHPDPAEREVPNFARFSVNTHTDTEHVALWREGWEWDTAAEAVSDWLAECQRVSRELSNHTHPITTGATMEVSR